MQKLKSTIQWLIYLLIFLIPWQTRWVYESRKLNGYFWEYGSSSLYVTEILIGFIMLLCIIYTVGLIKSKKQKPKQNLHAWLLFFAIVTALVSNLFAALNPALAWLKISQIILAVALIFCILLIKPDRSKATLLLILAASVQSILAIQQFVTQQVYANKWLGMAAQSPENLGVPVVETVGGRWLRAFGSLPHPNMLAGFLALSVILIVGMSALAKHPKWQKFLPLAFSLNFIGLMTTLSRGAVISLAIGLVIFSFLAKNKQELSRKITKFSLLALIIFILFTISFPGLIGQRVSGQNRLENISNHERLSQYETAWQIIKARPLTGVGLGNYTYASHLLKPALPAYAHPPVHNAYVLLIAELGLPAIMLLIFLIFIVIKCLIKKHRDSFKIMFCCAGLTLGMTALFDHYLFSLWFGILIVAVIIGFNLLPEKE